MTGNVRNTQFPAEVALAVGLLTVGIFVCTTPFLDTSMARAVAPDADVRSRAAADGPMKRPEEAKPQPGTAELFLECTDGDAALAESTEQTCVRLAAVVTSCTCDEPEETEPSRMNRLGAQA